MLTRMQLSIIVGLTMGISLLWLWIRGEQLTIGSVAATLGTVVSVLYGAVLFFAVYLWSWQGFRGWLVKRPDLRGSWRATLLSDWTDPKTNQKVPPIEAYMVVRQTLTTLSMRLFTQRSRSVLIAHAIEPEPDGLFSLSAVYRSSPKIEYQLPEEGAIHHGALLLEVHEVKPERLEGHYWTDRGTRGTIQMERKCKNKYSSFEDARRALAGTGA